MIVTKEWIHSHKSPKGGFTRKHIELLGLTWPAKKGWIRDIVGTEISDSDAERFESLSNQPVNQSLEKRVKSLESAVKYLEQRLGVEP